MQKGGEDVSVLTNIAGDFAADVPEDSPAVGKGSETEEKDEESKDKETSCFKPS